jgi:hypothetical protein
MIGARISETIRAAFEPDAQAFMRVIDRERHLASDRFDRVAKAAAGRFDRIAASEGVADLLDDHPWLAEALREMRDAPAATAATIGVWTLGFFAWAGVIALVVKSPAIARVVTGIGLIGAAILCLYLLARTAAFLIDPEGRAKCAAALVTWRAHLSALRARVIAKVRWALNDLRRSDFWAPLSSLHLPGRRGR